VIDSGKGQTDADPHPVVHECRRLRDHAGRVAGAARGSDVRPGESYGFPEFQESCDAALMGRTTFEPALGADRWPWPNLDVFVLGSHRPSGTPRPRGRRRRPGTAAAELREANRGGDVHLVGGPRTIGAFRALGALDKLGLIVLPLLMGDGMRLTPSLSADTELTLESERAALPSGSVEIVYDCSA
jgi:dihydrofolate reductase